MISIEAVSMEYPKPLRVREMIVSPFRRPPRLAALDRITLSIGAGERIAFLGPNGAGKTTLLKIIGGLIFPSNGTVKVCGLDTVRNNMEVRKRIGFVLNEDRSFYWRLTGEENLKFFGALDNLFRKELEDRVRHVIDIVGLGHHGSKRVSDYSSGMRQRLAIARGLLADPDILILDEPTRTLDPLGASEMRSLMAVSAGGGRGRTLLLATHQFEEAEMLCDRVCVVRGGGIKGLAAMRDLRYGGISLADFYARSLARKDP